MFTGLVEAIGTLRRRSGSPVARAFIATDLGPLVLGESVSVNGVCLTVSKILPSGFECDMSSETLVRTTLGRKELPAEVHLERAVPLGGRMGGHLVLGHVDGLGVVTRLEKHGDALLLALEAPAPLSRFLAPKGSVAIDGVSLTLNAVSPPGDGPVACELMLVPHTLAATLLGKLRVRAEVNIEVDVIARYVARDREHDGPLGAHERDVHAERSQPGGTEALDVDHDQRLLDKLGRGGFL